MAIAGLSEFTIQQTAVVAEGRFLGAILAEGFSSNQCGFGLRGLYCSQAPPTTNQWMPLYGRSKALTAVVGR